MGRPVPMILNRPQSIVFSLAIRNVTSVDFSLWHKTCLLDKEWLHAIPEAHTGIRNIGPIVFGAPLATK